MATLKVTVKQSTSKTGETSVEGTYQLPGSSLTKLAKKDGTTRFPNRATLNQTARRVGTALGWTVEYVETAKKAAKKSVKSKTAKPKAKRTAKRATPAPTTPTSSTAQ